MVSRLRLLVPDCLLLQMIDVLDLGLLRVKLFKNFSRIVIWGLKHCAHVRVQIDFLGEFLVYFELIGSTNVI